MDANTANIITTAIGALPGIIGLIKGQHAAANPDAPPMTDDQAKAALAAAIAESLAKDARLLQPRVASATELGPPAGANGE